MAQEQKRKPVPEKVQKEVALRQLRDLMTKLGFEEGPLELDHDPALGLRPIDPKTGHHVPHQHDPSAMVWRPKAEHKLKTTGRRGDSKLSIDFNGDQSRIAKTKRLIRAKTQEIARAEAKFRSQLLATDQDEMVEPLKARPSKWPKRPFPNRYKPTRVTS
jgi:hypothetical protein